MRPKSASFAEIAKVSWGRAVHERKAAEELDESMSAHVV
jgi:hypothetical protein